MRPARKAVRGAPFEALDDDLFDMHACLGELSNPTARRG